MKYIFHFPLQSYKIYKANFLFNKTLDSNAWNYYEGKANYSSLNGT
jgi:hypothetical protein